MAQSRPRHRRTPKSAKPELPEPRIDIGAKAIAHAEALDRLYGGLGFELWDGGLLIDDAVPETLLSERPQR